MPDVSENLSEATSIVVRPSVAGVKVAVETVEDTAEKLEIAPPATVMSSATKLVVASLVVKVSAIVASFVVSPELTSVEVIVIVGDVLS